MTKEFFIKRKRPLIISDLTTLSSIIGLTISSIILYRKFKEPELTLEEKLGRTSNNLINIINKYIDDRSDKRLYSFNYDDNLVKYFAISDKNIYICSLNLKNASSNFSIDDWLQQETIKSTSYSIDFNRKDIVLGPACEELNHSGAIELKYTCHKTTQESPDVYVSGVFCFSDFFLSYINQINKKSGTKFYFEEF